MDYDAGAQDLGLGSALDALLADASLSVEEAHPAGWEEASVLTAASSQRASFLRVSPSTEGGAPAADSPGRGGRAPTRVSPEDGPARALFAGDAGGFVMSDDDSGDEAPPPPSELGELRRWAARAAAKLKDYEFKGRQDELQILALKNSLENNAASLVDDLEREDATVASALREKEAAWLLEKATLEAVAVSYTHLTLPTIYSV